MQKTFNCTQALCRSRPVRPRRFVITQIFLTLLLSGGQTAPLSRRRRGCARGRSIPCPASILHAPVSRRSGNPRAAPPQRLIGSRVLAKLSDVPTAARRRMRPSFNKIQQRGLLLAALFLRWRNVFPSEPGASPGGAAPQRGRHCRCASSGSVFLSARHAHFAPSFLAPSFFEADR